MGQKLQSRANSSSVGQVPQTCVIPSLSVASFVYVGSWWGAGMHVCGGQSSPSDALPQARSTLVFSEKSFSGLELDNSVRLFDVLGL